ncbi:MULTISPECIES: helicase associated domain-containing protein [Streptomyces]|uniref:helicase associated domain-containing protein n=1 Tax=Streptomyces TaxID=1883 RepID=UPI0027B91231|nr:helicase associated domain-containing protein [Streptomyces sp. st170]
MFLRTRVLLPDSEIWLTGYNTLRTWVREHGHARVPSDTTVKSGDDDGTYGLGAWVSEQRRAFKAGTLKAWRVDLLNEVGMVWSVTRGSGGT